MKNSEEKIKKNSQMILLKEIVYPQIPCTIKVPKVEIKLNQNRCPCTHCACIMMVGLWFF
jgi:hypothetical protein